MPPPDRDAGDRRDLEEAHAFFAAHGIAPGPRGYDKAALIAAAETRGWHVGVDRTDGRYLARLTKAAEDGRPIAVEDEGRTAVAALTLALWAAVRRDAGHP